MPGMMGWSEMDAAGSDGGGGGLTKVGEDQLLADCNANQWLPVSGLCLRRLSSS